MRAMISVMLAVAGMSTAGTTLAQPAPQCSTATATTVVNRQLDEVQKLRAAARVGEAGRDVGALVAKYPATFRVLYVAALVEADQQQWSQAEARLKSAIALQDACLHAPGFVPDYTVYNTLGFVQMAQGRGGDAEGSYRLALTHSKDLTAASVARVNSNLGYLYFTQGNLKEARPLLQSAAIAGNTRAVNTLNTMDKAEAIYQSQIHRPVEQPFRLYYVIAMTSDSRQDLERAMEKVQAQVGSIRFKQEFPNIEVYRPSPDYQYTLLVSSAPLSYSAALQLKATAISAGFAQDTWLWGGDENYFSTKK